MTNQPDPGWGLPPSPAPKKSRRRLLIGIIITVATVVVVGGGIFAWMVGSRTMAFSKVESTAIEACESAIAYRAKYPAAVEYEHPLSPNPRRAEPQQGPDGTEFVTVNLGSVLFSNAFGVPTTYQFGCVTYHDGQGKLLDSQADVREGHTAFDTFMYSPQTDTLE